MKLVSEKLFDVFENIDNSIDQSINGLNEEHTEIIFDLLIKSIICKYQRWDTLPIDGSIENRLIRLVKEVLDDEGFDYESPASLQECIN